MIAKNRNRKLSRFDYLLTYADSFTQDKHKAIRNYGSKHMEIM